MGAGERGDPGDDVDGKPAEITCHKLALPRVNSATQLQAQSANGFACCHSALNCPPRPVEPDQKAITGVLDLTTGEPFKLAPHQGIVARQRLAPSHVS